MLQRSEYNSGQYEYLPYLTFFPFTTRSLEEAALREDDIQILRQLVTNQLNQTPLTDTDAMSHVRLAHIEQTLQNIQAAFREHFPK